MATSPKAGWTGSPAHVGGELPAPRNPGDCRFAVCLGFLVLSSRRTTCRDPQGWRGMSVECHTVCTFARGSLRLASGFSGVGKRVVCGR